MSERPGLFSNWREAGRVFGTILLYSALAYGTVFGAVYLILVYGLST